MKNVILAILILIAVQPLQASFCEMEMGQVTQQIVDANSPDSDCCNYEQPDSSGSCDPLAHCGAAPTGVTVLDGGLDSSPVFTAGNLPTLKNELLSSSYHPPLYRPPIS